MGHLPNQKPVTVMVALVELVTPPDDAEITTVPFIPAVCVAVAKPAETVTKLVLLEDQLAKEVTSTVPLQVVAFAVNWKDCIPGLGLKVSLGGVIAIDWIQPTVTVTVCVPVIAEFCVEVAVTVAEPVLTDVTKPVVLTVAVDVGVMLQLTDG